MIRCYIALGSNLNQPVKQVQRAVEALRCLPQSRWIAVSSFYQSRPLGSLDQPDYINAVTAVDTQLPPLHLLDALQKIEQQQGRIRNQQRWAPRSLDLDLLLYGMQHITTCRLTVPHHEMWTRAFVLYPLAEIAPDLTLPTGESLQEQLHSIPFIGLHRYTACTLS